ncbi:MAG: 23S rRNA (adenine(2503)-C(2))-methyltransferase RlmN [Anaerolineales bacterium]
MKKNLFDLDFNQLREEIQDWNEPGYRTGQIWQGLYQSYWRSFAEFTNIPLPLRDKLGQMFNLGVLTAEESYQSEDGLTRKTLYRLPDGAAIETVLMEYIDRFTVCISSQVGCGMECSFCATGNMGFTRNLLRGEIVEQVIKTAAYLQENGKTLTNVVFMGMGEPFNNYQAVLEAIQILNNPRGFGMGARRFTISTVGLVPGIKKFTEESSQINLAISLHAADDRLRSTIVPINTNYPLAELLEACQEYLRKTNRRITFEWALIDGLNDTDDQAQKLVALLKGMLVHVNLIQLNPVDHFHGKPSANNTAKAFQKILSEGGIPCTIRLRRGIDIQAGCGQLASKSK